jgi:hypothetical protein
MVPSYKESWGVEGVIRRYDVVIDRGLARAQSERNVGLAGGRVTRSESYFRISITFTRITARQEQKQTELVVGLLIWIMGRVMLEAIIVMMRQW